MSKIILTILLPIFLIVLTEPINAQVQLSVNMNYGIQPVWGPVGYDYVENYYLPDIEAYYNVPAHRYYYYNNGAWINSYNLPVKYKSYNIYNSYKVVVNEKNPWKNHKDYKIKYVTYKGKHDQQVIRDSRDSKYFVIKNHPEHKTWVQKQNVKVVKNGNGIKQNNGNSGNNGKGNNGKGKGKK